MNTAAIFELAVSTLAQYGLLEQGWKVAWDNGKRRAGACHYATRTISISKVLMPSAPDHEVRETILHEVAHALTPGHHHDATWAAKLREMGGTGSRTHSIETPAGRYEMHCTTCGVIDGATRHAAQGTWKANVGKPSNYRYYVHRKCGTGKLFLVDTKAPVPVEFALAASAPKSTAPKADVTTGKVCLCGCGESVKGTYRPGHDARHVSATFAEWLASGVDTQIALDRFTHSEKLQAKLRNRIETYANRNYK